MSGFAQRFRSPVGLTIAGVLTFVVGGAAGSAVTRATAPVEVMAPGNPVPVAQLAQASQPWVGEPVVTVRGRVAEVYGDRFVLADGSGRVLVELGRRGDVAQGLAANQEVTVQGRYGDNVIRARYLVGADGRVAALGRGRGGGRDHGPGPGGRHGERLDGPDAPPPAEAPAPAPAPVANQAG